MISFFLHAENGVRGWVWLVGWWVGGLGTWYLVPGWVWGWWYLVRVRVGLVGVGLVVPGTGWVGGCGVRGWWYPGTLVRGTGLGYPQNPTQYGLDGFVQYVPRTIEILGSFAHRFKRTHDFPLVIENVVPGAGLAYIGFHVVFALLVWVGLVWVVTRHTN